MQGVIQKMLQLTQQEDLKNLDLLMDNKELNGLDEWSRVIQVYQRKNEANERRSKKARILLEELENLKRTRDDLKDQINM
jgi:hypothetical protein